MYFASATTCTGYVARGIASGQGGTPIRLTCHAADIDHSLHCGRGAASGGGTAPLSTHHTADVHRAADAARHRAVFNGAPAKSCHAAGKARTVIVCYLYALHHHVLHRASFTETAEQTRIFVICRNGQPRNGMAAAVEGAGV